MSVCVCVCVCVCVSVCVCVCLYVCVCVLVLVWKCMYQVPCGDMWPAAGAQNRSRSKSSSVAIEAFNLIFVQVSFSVVPQSPVSFCRPSARLFLPSPSQFVRFGPC